VSTKNSVSGILKFLGSLSWEPTYQISWGGGTKRNGGREKGGGGATYLYIMIILNSLKISCILKLHSYGVDK